MAEPVSSDRHSVPSNLPELGAADAPDARLLPLPLTPLVGREHDIAAVNALLMHPTNRLVTLVGPGGIGKTRLAIAVAEGRAGDFPDGTQFVDLSSLTDPDLVPLTIARQLELPEGADRSPLDNVIRALESQRRLLVLDNWERIVAAAPFVSQLLASCPGLKVLATSRVALDIRGERQYAPPPLSVPERRPDGRLLVPALDKLAQIPAVALFLDRAQAVDPAFALTAANAEAVAEICHRLDGLPLAIELAASRCRLLSPGEIRDRLTAPLDFLTSGPRDLPDRQQTLRSSIAWSYDLLAPEAQSLFRRLAVFSGGFSLEAAEAIAGNASFLPVSTSPHLPVFDVVASLVEQNLVRSLDGRLNETRFGMLETVREYADELLIEGQEAEEVQAAHAEYFLDLATRAFPHLRGTDQVAWLDRMDAEHANFRAALRWAEVSEPATVAALAEMLWVFWWLRGHFTEGRSWMGRALAIEGVDPEVRAKILLGAGTIAHYQGDFPAAEAHYHEALSTARSAGVMPVAGSALGNLGTLALERGDLVAAEALQEESLAIDREAGNRQGIAMSLGNLGVLAWERGDLARAADLFEECLGLARELGDQESVGLSLLNLGEVAGARGDPATAERYYEEAVALMRQAGSRHGLAIALNSLAELARSRHDVARAAMLLHECLELARESGGTPRLATYLESVARLAISTHPEGGARLYGVATTLRVANDMAPSRSETEQRDSDLTVLRQRLGPAAFDAAWTAGRRLPLDDAVAEAIALTQSPELASSPVVSKAAVASGHRARSSLTKRELEILRLLVEGKSDREIADALFLSRGTVSNYVMSILAKLGVSSRTAAATRAVRDSLI